MPKSIVAILGGKSYTVESLPIKRSKAWREQLAGPFGQLAAALEGAGDIELTSGRDIAGLISVLNHTLIGSIDVLQDLLFEYSPTLAADRERIENEAYDEEALAAFIEVLKLAYPFGGVLTLVTGATKKRIT